MEIFKSWLVEKFIAHRGFFNNEDFPENSLGAFEQAIEKGYAIELDVHVISDGTVVVFHDSQLGRMTGKDGYVKNLKHTDLKNYKLLDTEYTIPTLDEVLALVDNRTPILVEIKSENIKVGVDEAKIYEILKKYNGQFAVQSFNPFSIEWFKNNAPEITRGILSAKFTKNMENRPKSFIKRLALRNMWFNKRAKPQFIAYNVEDLPNIFIKNKCKGLPVLGWTVKSQTQYLEIIKYVDNIIFQDFEPKI